jgi:hypothetical protein
LEHALSIEPWSSRRHQRDDRLVLILLALRAAQLDPIEALRSWQNAAPC